MPVIARNQLKIERAGCIDGKRTVYRVDGVPGLELDVTPNGSRTWRVRYQVGRGATRKERRYTIGDANAIKLLKATEKAHEVIAAAQVERRDPHADRKASDLSTFGALFDAWLEKHAKPNKSSWKADEDLYNRHVKAHLAHRPIADMRKRDFVAVLDAIEKASTGSQANASQALITAVLNWSENDGRIDAHAAHGIPKRHQSKSRDRVLKHDELRKFWRALDTEVTPRMARVLRVLLLTGVRLSAGCGMAKRELQGDLWEIADRAGAKGVPTVVPVTSEVGKIIAAAIADSGDSPFVFPAFRRGVMMNDKSVTRHAPDHAYADVARKLGFVDGDGAVDTGVHDLRRTVATNMARLGIPGELIDRVQGRVAGSNKVSAIYNRHAYLDEKRDALERWERELMRIVGAPE